MSRLPLYPESHFVIRIPGMCGAYARPREEKIGTVAGVRGTPLFHLMYVVERRPPSILG